MRQEPRHDIDEISLCDDTLLVTTYLTQKFAMTDLDKMVQKHAIAGFRPRFSESLKASKMASTEDSGETMLFRPDWQSSGLRPRAKGPAEVREERPCLDGRRVGEIDR